MNSATKYTTTDAVITVTDTSIAYYYGSSEGGQVFDVSSAEFDRVARIVGRQVTCGPTTADFLAAQHLFVPEAEALAWLDLLERAGRVTCVDAAKGLYTVVEGEEERNVQLSDEEIAEGYAEDFWFDC